MNAPFKLVGSRRGSIPAGWSAWSTSGSPSTPTSTRSTLNDLASKKDHSGKGEVGNMSFSARTLTDAELKAHSKATEWGSRPICPQ